MKKKNIVVIFLLSLAVLSITAICWAADRPSELVVVRAADNSLWKAMCTATSCTDFTSFPGMFASTPTVVWDEVLGKYVIWGRAADGSIWRATFDYDGTFNNDWVSIPGSTPSQIGAVGSKFKIPFTHYSPTGSIDVSTISTDCDNMTDLAFVYANPPSAGWVEYVFTDGIYAPGSANKWVRVCLSTTSGGSSCDSWGPFLESDTIGPQYEGEKRFALNMTYPFPDADTTITFYLKACRESGATGDLLWDRLIANIGD